MLCNGQDDNLPRGRRKGKGKGLIGQLCCSPSPLCQGDGWSHITMITAPPSRFPSLQAWMWNVAIWLGVTENWKKKWCVCYRSSDRQGQCEWQVGILGYFSGRYNGIVMADLGVFQHPWGPHGTFTQHYIRLMCRFFLSSPPPPAVTPEFLHSTVLILSSPMGIRCTSTWRCPLALVKDQVDPTLA